MVMTGVLVSIEVVVVRDFNVGFRGEVELHVGLCVVSD